MSQITLDLDQETENAMRAAASDAGVSASRWVSGLIRDRTHAGENVTVEPMSRIRQITAAHMVYSKAMSAQP